MSCPRTQHLNNVPISRGDKHDISLKILHQAGFENERQAATFAKLRTLSTVPCPSLSIVVAKKVQKTVRISKCIMNKYDVMHQGNNKDQFAVANLGHYIFFLAEEPAFKKYSLLAKTGCSCR